MKKHDFDDDEMEMPTPCMKCGDIFDLHDGTAFENIIYCEPCGDKLNRIKELEDEIEYSKDRISSWKKDLDDAIAEHSELINELSKIQEDNA